MVEITKSCARYLKAHVYREPRKEATMFSLNRLLAGPIFRAVFGACVIAILLCLPAYSHAQLWSGVLDPSRAIDWSTGYAGVAGGIPTNQAACSALNTSATMTTINNEISRCHDIYNQPNGEKQLVTM